MITSFTGKFQAVFFLPTVWIEADFKMQISYARFLCKNTRMDFRLDVKGSDI